MTFKTETEQCAAIRAFLARAAHGRLADLWTERGPTELACSYVANGSPLSHGEAILLRVAFDVWNGGGATTLDEMLTTLDDDNLAAVLALIGSARPGAARRAGIE